MTKHHIGKAIVGKFYYVRHARITGIGGGYWGKEWIPIIGPLHEDADVIGLETRHYHVDYRFLPQRIFDRLPYEHAVAQVFCVENSLRSYDIEYSTRRVRCRREPPDFPQRRAKWQDTLRAEYAECTLKPGLICPHKGIPLAGHVDSDGIATCPGHGLRWNTRTGRLVEAPDA